MLNYKAKTIAKAERESGLNFFKTLEGFSDGAPSLTSILFILQSGGLTEDEASDLIDEKGLVESIQVAVNALTESGFLAKAMRAAEKAQAQTSPSTGEKTKA